MKSKASKKSTKSNQLNPKNNPSKKPSKKPSKLNNKDTLSRASKNLSKKSKKLLSTGEKEIEAQSLASNKSQISDLNILSKNSDMTRIKTYEIQSDEQVSFLLSFEIVKEKIKISVIEKESFPQNKYENYYSLEDFIKINKWFNIFYNIESLLTEFEQLTKNEYFTIEQKNKNVLSLFIIINNLDLVSQLISKITEIESKENNDINFFDEKIDNLGHLLQIIEEANKAREEELLNQQNENEILNNEENKEENKEEKSENKSNKSNTNLEEMKDALKLQIEKKIKNDTNPNNPNEINNNALIHENENKENENLNEELLLPINPSNIPFSESTIISTTEAHKIKELRLLKTWLVQTLNSDFTTKLIFSSENSDDKAVSFHQKCDNIAPTLTLIETKEGFRYGGFTSQFWESSEQSIFKKDKNAFIFSLDTEKKYEIINEEKSIQCSMYWGPYFGEGGAICVPDNFLEEKNAFYQWPSSYDITEKDELTFGQEHNINISKYEVYEIILINDENENNNIENENNENNENVEDKEEKNANSDIKELAPRKIDEDENNMN